MKRRKAKSGNPALAIAYLRVSTEDQRLGPEAQRAAIEAFAASRELTVASWHVDQGVCGEAALFERPALMAALVDVKEKQAGALLCLCRDRLARDRVVASMIERTFEAAGARVVTADGLPADDSPESKLIRGLMDLFAEFELAKIRGRTKAALGMKKARGEVYGEVPYGFRRERPRFKNSRLLPDETEQRNMAMIRHMRSLGFTLLQVEAGAFDSGVRSRSGGRMCFQTISRLLSRMAPVEPLPSPEAPTEPPPAVEADRTADSESSEPCA